MSISKFLRQIFIVTVLLHASNGACRCGADMTQSKEAVAAVAGGSI